jgi:hypothetical protein
MESDRGALRLLRPLPYAHPEELIALRITYTDGRMTTGLVAMAEVMRITESNISTGNAVAVTASPFEPTLPRDNASPVHVAAYGVSEGFFEIFGLPMTLSRSARHQPAFSG